MMETFGAPMSVGRTAFLGLCAGQTPNCHEAGCDAAYNSGLPGNGSNWPGQCTLHHPKRAAAQIGPIFA
jgi:hypothetical protein